PAQVADHREADAALGVGLAQDAPGPRRSRRGVEARVDQLDPRRDPLALGDHGRQTAYLLARALAPVRVLAPSRVPVSGDDDVARVRRHIVALIVPVTVVGEDLAERRRIRVCAHGLPILRRSNHARSCPSPHRTGPCCTGGLPAGLDVLQSITRILLTPSNFPCFFTRSEQLAHDARWSERVPRVFPTGPA